MIEPPGLGDVVPRLDWQAKCGEAFLDKSFTLAETFDFQSDDSPVSISAVVGAQEAEGNEREPKQVDKTIGDAGARLDAALAKLLKEHELLGKTNTKKMMGVVNYCSKSIKRPLFVLQLFPLCYQSSRLFLIVCSSPPFGSCFP